VLRRLFRYGDIDMLDEGSARDHPGIAMRFELNLTTGAAAAVRLTDDWSLDFPVVPPVLVGRPHKFTYMAGVPINEGVPDPKIQISGSGYVYVFSGCTYIFQLEAHAERYEGILLLRCLDELEVMNLATYFVRHYFASPC
jgi:hypothetical protein